MGNHQLGDGNALGGGLLRDEAVAEHVLGQIAHDLGIAGEVDAALESVAEAAHTTASSMDLRFDHKLLGPVLGSQVMSGLLSLFRSGRQCPRLSSDAKLIK